MATETVTFEEFMAIAIAERPAGETCTLLYFDLDAVDRHLAVCKLDPCPHCGQRVSPWTDRVRLEPAMPVRANTEFLIAVECAGCRRVVFINPTTEMRRCWTVDVQDAAGSHTRWKMRKDPSAPA